MSILRPRDSVRWVRAVHRARGELCRLRGERRGGQYGYYKGSKRSHGATSNITAELLHERRPLKQTRRPV